jgi:hypothetical protein
MPAIQEVAKVEHGLIRETGGQGAGPIYIASGGHRRGPRLMRVAGGGSVPRVDSSERFRAFSGEEDGADSTSGSSRRSSIASIGLPDMSAEDFPVRPHSSPCMGVSSV